jgi:DNA-binding transcriptional LysR family regulator
LKCAPGLPSVDQLLVLLAVVEEGSFTRAAKRLGRANSAITYAIDALEAQLGIALFDRKGTRKRELTPMGEAIVVEAKAVAHSIETLRARVRGLLDGLESEVALVVDAVYPNDRLLRVLESFYQQFPTVPLRVSLRALEGVERLVRGGDSWIGVAGHLHTNTTGLRTVHIGGVPFIAVAALNHPLARSGVVSPARARDHLQLILSDQPGPDDREYGVLSLANWRISDLNLKHKLLLAGIGWGGMPEPMVRTDIKSRQLVALNIADGRAETTVCRSFIRSKRRPVLQGDG